MSEKKQKKTRSKIKKEIKPKSLSKSAAVRQKSKRNSIKNAKAKKLTTVQSKKTKKLKSGIVNNLSNCFEEREKDWRNNQIIYQVLVDRFYRSNRINEIEQMICPPQKLREWHELPHSGHFLDEVKYWQHELEFWGGDLQGLMKKIDYIKSLGVNTLYLNPIFQAYSNHKYDTTDYFSIDPMFGDKNDLAQLTNLAHKNEMKVVLDGVFNHMGIKSTWFNLASEKKRAYKNFFTFHPALPNGFVGWANVPNLPELNIDAEEVKKVIYKEKNSVVQSYLQMVDGWRLDVAHNLGEKNLAELTCAAHQAKSDALVVGEIWNYPDGWKKSLDGIMNFYQSRLYFKILHGQINAFQFAAIFSKMVADASLEFIMKCWIVLSNHDTPRLKHLLKEEADQKLAIFMQMVFPGSPVIYYGEEIGMDGAMEPECRAPFNWPAVNEENSRLNFYKQMIALRYQFRALRVGEITFLMTEKLVAFIRNTERVEDFVLVVINPSYQSHEEIVCLTDYKIMNGSRLTEHFGGEEVRVECGMVKVKLLPKSFALYKLELFDGHFSEYKRLT